MRSIREKLSIRGIESLSDKELIALLTEDSALADEIMAQCGNLTNIAQTQPARLRMVAGMGLRNADKIQAALEIGRRIASSPVVAADTITSSNDVVDIMRPQLNGLKYEECWAIYLTNSNRIIEQHRISQGGIQATVVDSRLVVKRALELLATRIILVHNHPSGNAVPSQADIELTAKVKEATDLFDIQLLDHIIVSSTDSYSFKSSGKL